MNTIGLKANKEEYILNAIYATSYTDKEGEIELDLNDKDKLQYIADKLKDECYCDYTMNKFKNNYTAIIADFIQGLPSWLNIAFSNYDILQIAKIWGRDVSTEKLEDSFLLNWWELIATNIINLFNKHKIDYKI